MKELLKVGQLYEVFLPNELAQLASILSKIPQKSNPSSNYTSGFQPDDFIYPYIKKTVIERVEPLLKTKLNLTHGVLLEEYKPWTIHTDYYKGDDNPGLAMLIPLNTEPLNTCTVIFNEETVDSFSDFKKVNSKLKNNATNLHDSIMSHETLENLEYVSLYKAMPWIPGSVIFWDRRLLHSSDNFLANAVTKKTALILFFHT